MEIETKVMDSVDAAIMVKVNKKEIYLKDYKRCLAVNICPRCGGNLNHIGEKYICLSAACVLGDSK